MLRGQRTDGVRIPFDLMNIFDKVYELRDGAAPAWAPRSWHSDAIYGIIAYDF